MTQQLLTTAPQIEAWCINYVARTLNMPKAKVDPSVPVDRFGLDSATAVALIMDLEAELQIELAPELLFEYPTLSALSAYLASRVVPNQLAA